MWTASRQSRWVAAEHERRQEKLALGQAALILHEPLSRPIFPYSVIPGGIGSVDDIKAAMARDPVVAAHYAGLDLANTHFTHADSERQVYVSYRVGDHVYWTSKKLTIKPGEGLATDGNVTARGRCGNLISQVAMTPVFPGEPSSKVFDEPEPEAPEIADAGYAINPDLAGPPDLIPPVSSSSSAASTFTTSRGNTGVPGPTVYYPVGGGSGSPVGGGSGNSAPNLPGPPSTAVPEPGTALLLLSGFTALGYLFRRQRMRASATELDPQ